MGDIIEDEQLGIQLGKNGAVRFASSTGRYLYASNHVSSTRHLSDKQVERLEEFLSRHAEQLGSDRIADIRLRYLAPRSSEPRRAPSSPPPAPESPDVEVEETDEQVNDEQDETETDTDEGEAEQEVEEETEQQAPQQADNGTALPNTPQTMRPMPVIDVDKLVAPNRDFAYAVE